MYEKDVKKYLDEVGRYLVCSEKQKKKILKAVKVLVTDFILENNIMELNEVYERFGSPEDIAKNYIADVNPADVRKALNKKKILIIAVVIALVIWGLVGFFAWLDAHNEGPGYIVEGPAIEAEEGVDVHAEDYEVVL